MINPYLLRKTCFSIFLFYFILSFRIIASDTTYYELWNINSLDNTGGHTITISGNPQVIITEIGDAVEFDGDGDMLLVDSNPIGDSKEFTVEVVFKPDAGINIINEPRFIHIGESNAERVMMEIRVNDQNEWYLDGFMKTDKEDLTLIDETKTHPIGDWMHAAITYENNTFKTYVNGEEELSGQVGYTNKILNSTGKTSIGARMNEKNWYSGLVKTLKITYAALNPDQFIFINEEDTTNENPTKINFVFLEENIKIFPNPANQVIHVYLKGLNNLNYTEIIIFNILGETIYKSNLYTNNLNIINTSELNEGLYFITINTGKINISRKIYIEH